MPPNLSINPDNKYLLVIFLATHCARPQNTLQSCSSLHEKDSKQGTDTLSQSCVDDKHRELGEVGGKTSVSEWHVTWDLERENELDFQSTGGRVLQAEGTAKVKTRAQVGKNWVYGKMARA